MHAASYHAPTRVALAALAFATLALVASARDAAAQSATPAPAAGSWTLGIDAAVSSTREHFRDVDIPRVTRFVLPARQIRVGYRVTPAVQVELPASLSYYSTEGRSVAQTMLGADLNFDVASRATVRPLIGAGARLAYQRFHANGSGDVGAITEHASQYGYAARLGLEWYALPALSLRPALFAEHLNGNEKKDLPSTDAFGVSLGATMRFDDARREAMPFQLSVSGAIARTTAAAFTDPRFGQDVPRQSITSVALPSAGIGLFVPVARDGQVMVGSNLFFARSSNSHAFSRTFELQPRVELNLNPRFRTERGVRIGAHANIENTGATRGYYPETLTRFGAGADVSLTFPTTGSILSRVGLGVDHLAAKSNKGVPASTAVSLKFGFDVL